MYAGPFPIAATLAIGMLMICPASADQMSIDAGRKVAVANCTACHLANGATQPDPSIPRLPGLTAGYIDEQLEYYATGARQNPIMTPFAAALTEVQRRQLADYFASLPAPPVADPGPASGATSVRGRDLFLKGDFKSGASACALCHGRSGLGVGEFSPRIAGQSADYVTAQMNIWRAGHLRDPKGIFMQAEGRHLSPSNIEAVAAYAAALGADESNKP